MGIPYSIGLTLLLSPALNKSVITKLLRKNHTQITFLYLPVSVLAQYIVFLLLACCVLVLEADSQFSN